MSGLLKTTFYILIVPYDSWMAHLISTSLITYNLNSRDRVEEANKQKKKRKFKAK